MITVRSRRLLTICPMLLLLVAAGCTGGDGAGGKPGEGGPGDPGAIDMAIRAQVPLPQAQSLKIDVGAAWGPMLLRVKGVEFDPTDPHVRVDTSIEMVTEHPDMRIFEQVAVHWGANWIWLDQGRSQIPAVAPRGTGSAQLVFPVDPAALMVPGSGLGDLSEASLVLAGGWRNHTVVPFGDGPARLNGPTEFEVSGTLSSPAGTVTVSGGRVSMGRQGDWPPIDHERAWVQLNYDVTAADDVPFPGVFTERTMMLKLPDGSSVRAADGVPFDLLVAAGDTVSDAVIGFPVALPVSGNYQLQWGGGTLDFTVNATGFGAKPWVPDPLVREVPACVRVASERARAVSPLDRPFGFGTIAARLCQVETEGDTLWATIMITNPFQYPLELGFRLGGLHASGGQLKAPIGAGGWRGSNIPSRGTGVVRMQFDGVSSPDGLVLAAKTRQGFRDLVALDPAGGPDGSDSVGVAVAAEGDLLATDTLVRVRDAGLLTGTFDGPEPAPKGRRFLVVRFDFYAGGAVPLLSTTPQDVFKQVGEFLTLYTLGAPGPFKLATPDGSELVPVITTPVNPAAYPREQIRGVVLHFDLPEPVTGTYRLTYTNEDESASLDIKIE